MAAAAAGGASGSSAAGEASSSVDTFEGEVFLGPIWQLAGEQQLVLQVKGLGEVPLQLLALQQPAFQQLTRLVQLAIMHRIIDWTSAIANGQLNHQQMVDLRVRELEPARVQLHSLLVSALPCACPRLPPAASSCLPAPSSHTAPALGCS